MDKDWADPENAHSDEGDWPGDDYDDNQRRWFAAGKCGMWWTASPEEVREVFGVEP